MAVITSIGERLKMLRKKSGLTQGELAERISVSRESVAKWESQCNIIPKVFDVIALADFYGVSCDYILRGWETENKTITEQLGLTSEAVDGLKKAAMEHPEAILLFSQLFSSELDFAALLCDVEQACAIWKDSPRIQDELTQVGVHLSSNALVKVFCNRANEVFEQEINNFVRREDLEHAAKENNP